MSGNVKRTRTTNLTDVKAVPAVMGDSGAPRVLLQLRVTGVSDEVAVQNVSMDPAAADHLAAILPGVLRRAADEARARARGIN